GAPARSGEHGCAGTRIWSGRGGRPTVVRAGLGAPQTRRWTAGQPWTRGGSSTRSSPQHTPGPGRRRRGTLLEERHGGDPTLASRARVGGGTSPKGGRETGEGATLRSRQTRLAARLPARWPTGGPSGRMSCPRVFPP